MIRCIIIEDEPLATEKLEGFIQKHPQLELAGVFHEALEPISFLKENEVNLVFLDIEMQGFNGIQFLETITNRPSVIITSAYDQYALKCYEFSVDDYLLKPYSFERFVKAIEKVVEYRELSKQGVVHQRREYIFIHTEYRLEKVVLNDILYVEGMKDYLQIVTSSKKLMTLQSFKGIMEVLPANEFVRTHRSFIVSISKIENIERNRIKIGDKQIPVGDSFKDKFYELINDVNRV